MNSALLQVDAFILLDKIVEEANAVPDRLCEMTAKALQGVQDSEEGRPECLEFSSLSQLVGLPSGLEILFKNSQGHFPRSLIYVSHTNFNECPVVMSVENFWDSL